MDLRIAEALEYLAVYLERIAAAEERRNLLLERDSAARQAAFEVERQVRAAEVQAVIASMGIADTTSEGGTR